MKCYFIVTTFMDGKDITPYKEYIKEVKPIVERFGGRYLARTEKIVPLSDLWKPDRVIVIEFPSRERLDACFSSEEYGKVKGKREQSVDSRAIIVEGVGEDGD